MHGEELQYQRETGMICMLFPLCDPALSFMIFQTSELAVDEDGIESDGVAIWFR